MVSEELPVITSGTKDLNLLLIYCGLPITIADNYSTFKIIRESFEFSFDSLLLCLMPISPPNCFN